MYSYISHHYALSSIRYNGACPEPETLTESNLSRSFPLTLRPSPDSRLCHGLSLRLRSGGTALVLGSLGHSNETADSSRCSSLRLIISASSKEKRAALTPPMVDSPRFLSAGILCRPPRADDSTSSHSRRRLSASVFSSLSRVSNVARRFSARRSSSDVPSLVIDVAGGGRGLPRKM